LGTTENEYGALNMERTNNPFDGLIAAFRNRKAFFELGSNESQAIPLCERIKIMARFVMDGYDMHELVFGYLDDKDALDDDLRKNCIAATFRMYADDICCEPDTDDWVEAVTKMLVGGETKTSSEAMRDAIDKFIDVVIENKDYDDLLL